jgi:CRP-like cAMP-binding protein
MGSFLESLTEAVIPDEEMRVIKAAIKTKEVLKGEILLRKGDMAAKVFYVKRGCLRSYAIDEKGKEHIFMFAPEGWIVSNMESNVNNATSMLFIDAIEDSSIEVIDIKLFSMPVGPRNAAIEKLTRRISVLQKRIIMLMSATLQERYLDFVETYPDIVQRVPQKMIASYLGVTPEALSKIRGNMAKNK